MRPAAVPEDLACCLGAMVERLAHMLYVLQVASPDEQGCLRALTGIWLSSLGLVDADTPAIGDRAAVGAHDGANDRSTDGQGSHS